MTADRAFSECAHREVEATVAESFSGPVNPVLAHDPAAPIAETLAGDSFRASSQPPPLSDWLTHHGSPARAWVVRCDSGRPRSRLRYVCDAHQQRSR